MSAKRSVPGSPSSDGVELPEAKRRAVDIEEGVGIRDEGQPPELISNIAAEGKVEEKVEEKVDDELKTAQEVTEPVKVEEEKIEEKTENEKIKDDVEMTDEIPEPVKVEQPPNLYQVRLLIVKSLAGVIAPQITSIEENHSVKVISVEGSAQSIDSVLTVSADTKEKVALACKDILNTVVNRSPVGSKGPTCRILVDSRALVGSESRESFVNTLKNLDLLATISKSCLPGSMDKLVSFHSDDFGSIKQLIEYIAEFTLLKGVDSTNGRNQFVPKMVTGILGHPSTFTRQKINEPLASRNPYIIYDLIARPGMPLVSPAVPVAAEPVQVSAEETMQDITEEEAHYEAQRTSQVDEEITQQIFIPSEMVGNVIGKQGANISEIRNKSGSLVQVFQAQGDSKERRVTVTGTKAGNKIALAMLFKKLETEKAHYQRLKRGG